MAEVRLIAPHPASARERGADHIPVAHHFVDAHQQHEAAGLGMWTFLATEIMFFGGLFAGYTVYRSFHDDAFARASEHLYKSIGAINTAILLTSSLTMVLGVHAADQGDRRGTRRYLWITAALGLAFLVLKGVEYTLDFRDHLVPGFSFAPEGMPPAPAGAFEMFFVFYFIMTAIHGIHVTVGIAVIAILAGRLHRPGSTGLLRNSIEMTGLYWHFVDIVWIFLLPLLYLVR